MPYPDGIAQPCAWQSAIVDVLVPVALDQAYSYRVPDELDLAPGDIVAVPLGAREAIGVVWADNVAANPRPDNRLKDVEEKLDCRRSRASCAASSTGSRTTRWRRAAWCCAWRCAWASISAAERERVGVRLAGPPPQRMTAARARVLARSPTACCAPKPRPREEAGVSAGVIDGLIDEGTLEAVVLPPRAGRAPARSGLSRART